MWLIILFLICLVGMYLILHPYTTQYRTSAKINYISEYDDIDQDNYVTNVPYFRNDHYTTTNKIWAGKNGAPAPTGPAQGATPYAGTWLLPKSQKNYKNILNIPEEYTKYPKIGIDNERQIFILYPLI